MGRQFDQRRPARFLQAIAERRSTICDPARYFTQCSVRPKPALVVVRNEKFSCRAGAAGELIEYASENFPRSTLATIPSQQRITRAALPRQTQVTIAARPRQKIRAAPRMSPAALHP